MWYILEDFYHFQGHEEYKQYEQYDIQNHHDSDVQLYRFQRICPAHFLTLTTRGPATPPVHPQVLHEFPPCLF